MLTTRHSSTKEILDAAADLLDRPGGWTQFAFARDGAGNEVHPKDPRAVAFDVLGAIKRVGPVAEYIEKLAQEYEAAKRRIA